MIAIKRTTKDNKVKDKPTVLDTAEALVKELKKIGADASYITLGEIMRELEDGGIEIAEQKVSQIMNAEAKFMQSMFKRQAQGEWRVI